MWRRGRATAAGESGVHLSRQHGSGHGHSVGGGRVLEERSAIPPSRLPGNQTLDAVGQSSHLSASELIAVETNWLQDQVRRLAVGRKPARECTFRSDGPQASCSTGRDGLGVHRPLIAVRGRLAVVFQAAAYARGVRVLPVQAGTRLRRSAADQRRGRSAGDRSRVVATHRSVRAAFEDPFTVCAEETSRQPAGTKTISAVRRRVRRCSFGGRRCTATSAPACMDRCGDVERRSGRLTSTHGAYATRTRVPAAAELVATGSATGATMRGPQSRQRAARTSAAKVAEQLARASPARGRGQALS